MKSSAHLRPLALWIVATGLTAHASAQELVPPEPDPARLANAPVRAAPGGDWQFQIGAGMLLGPAFLGSRDYQLRAGPSLDVCYRERLCLSVVDGASLDVVKTGGLRAGPILKYQEGRSQSGDNLLVVAGGRTHALRGLGDVDATLEAGGYLQYQLGRLSAKVEVREGLGGREGLVADLGVRLTSPVAGLSVVGRPILVSAGPRAILVDRKYNEAYFGIDAEQSARSGLRPFAPGGGLLSYGLGATLVIPVSESVSAALRGGLDRLAGDARRSPLVRERGARTQGTIGCGLMYRLGR